MKIDRSASLHISAPEFYQDPAFIEWLNNDQPKFTWHQGGHPGEWSDVVVGVDPSLSGEGTDTDMPEHIWEQIVQACREHFKSPAATNGHHILVWISNC